MGGMVEALFSGSSWVVWEGFDPEKIGTPGLIIGPMNLTLD